MTAFSVRPSRTPPANCSPLISSRERRIHRRFEDARLLDVPADAVELRAAVLLRPKLGEPLRAVHDDRRHVAQRLDVVDRGRLPVDSDHCRKRRFVARLRALALERLEQRRLLARFVGAGAAVHVDVAVEAGAEDVLAENPPGVGLVDGALELVLHVEELAANVDVGDLRANGIAANRAPFNQQVRIALDQQMVLEGAGLALVRIARDIAGLGLLVDELPLQSGRESGAAAAAQPRRLHQLDDLVGLLAQRDLQRVVTAVLDIEVQREGIRLADVLVRTGS